jgi:hypothetical protein
MCEGLQSQFTANRIRVIRITDPVADRIKAPRSRHPATPR